MTRRAQAALLLTALVLCAGGCATDRPGARPCDLERVMKVTAYCACGTCCGWERNWLGRPVYSSGPRRGQRKAVGVTASGTRVRHGTIAADPSRYPFGTILYVPGYGYGTVEDVGGAIKGHHIDLYFRTHRQALEWGVQRLRVKVWLP
jgi:3D (Asp-Asp-Asp) domain-containing protein